MSRIFVLSIVAVIALTYPVASAQNSTRATAARSFGSRASELRLEGVPLRDAIDHIRNVAGLNVHVDWKAIAEVGIEPTTLVSVNARNITARRALQMVLNEAAGGDELTFYIDDGVVHVTTRAVADQKLITHVYIIGDLIAEIPDFDDAPDLDINTSGRSGGGGGQGSGGSGGGLFGSGGSAGGSGNGGGNDNNLTPAQRRQQLISLITSTIEPDIWRDNGGTASIAIFNDRMIVTAPRSVHEKLGGRR